MKAFSPKTWKEYSAIEWIIFMAGVIGLFVFLSSLFTPLGEKKFSPFLSDSASSTTFSFDDPRFIDSMEGITGSTFKYGEVPKILINGSQFVPDLFTEIKSAKKSITITDFIWDDGSFGNTLFDALTEKAKGGVEVRVLLDGTGGRKADNEYIKSLRAAGGMVSSFRPIKFGNIFRTNRRDHVRTFVIDGITAYTGGIAISDNWLGNATSTTSWHDFMFKMNGSMAEEVQKIFSYLWSETTGEIISGSPFYPDITDSQTILESASSSAKYISYLSSPSPNLDQSLGNFFWLSIKAATSSIHIENPYIILDKATLTLLEEKARQGVNVEVVLPGPHTDQPHVKLTSEYYYKGLLDAGVAIYEYQPSRIHAKTLIVDNRWSVIGSPNLDSRSRILNLEDVFGVDSTTFAQSLESEFNKDKLRSKQITKEVWNNRSVLWIPIEYISGLFIKLY